MRRFELTQGTSSKFWEIDLDSSSKLRSGQRRQSIITACWKQAELW